MCRIRPKFASLMLPHLVYDIALSQGTKAGDETDCIECINSQFQFFLRKDAAIEERVIDDLFAVVHHLRRERLLLLREVRKEARNRAELRRKKIQECLKKLNYLEIAEAAERLRMHYSSLVLLESYSDLHADSPSFSLLASDRTDELLGFLDKRVGYFNEPNVPRPSEDLEGKTPHTSLGRTEAQTAKDLITRIFRHLDDPDAVYGVVSSQQDTDLLLAEHEGKWSHAMQMYDSMWQFRQANVQDPSLRNPSILSGNSPASLSSLSSGCGGKAAYSKKRSRAPSSSRPHKFKFETKSENLPKKDADGSGCNALNEKALNAPIDFEERLRLHEGLIGSFKKMGCSYTLETYMKELAQSDGDVYKNLADRHFEVAWRSSHWSLDETSSSEQPLQTFNVSLYSALLALRERNGRAFEDNISSAREDLMKQISRIGRREESFSLLQPYIVKLQLLNDAAEAWQLFGASRKRGPVLRRASSVVSEVLYAPSQEIQEEEKYAPDLEHFQKLFNSRLAGLHGKFELIEPVVALRTVLLELSGSVNLLGSHLRCASRMARDSGEPYSCRAYLKRAKSHPHLNLLRKLELQMEECHLAWDLSEEQTAIRGAMDLILRLRKTQPSHLADIPPKEIVEYQVDLHCLLGDWLSCTLSESTEVISRILESAKHCIYGTNGSKGDVKQAKHSLTEYELHKVHYQLGRFHDHAYQRLAAQKKSVEYQRSHELMEENKRKLRRLKTLREAEPVVKKRDLDRQMNSLMKKIKIDQDKHWKLDASVQTSLIAAVKCYNQCLRQGNIYDREVIYRLISLWFSNPSNEQVSRQMGYAIRNVPIYKFLPLVYQIASRLKTWDFPRSDPSDSDTLITNLEQHEVAFRKAIYDLVKEMALKHPFHALYQIFAIANGDKLHKKSRNSGYKVNVERKKAAETMLDELRSSPRKDIVLAVDALITRFIELSFMRTPDRSTMTLRHIPIGKLRSHILELIPIPTASIEVYPDGNYSDVPKIRKFGPTVRFANTGISRPMIIDCFDTAAKMSRVLAKPRDDLRQDAVMEQVFRLVNGLLSSNVQTRRRQLGMRTYNVVPFTPCVGLVEWVLNTTSIGDYLSKEPSGAHFRYSRPGQKWLRTRDIQNFLIQTSEATTGKTSKGLYDRYTEVTQDFQPVFRHFFLERFLDPCEWFHRRIAYTRSVAVGSIVGYVVGLGDRHCQNILIDKQSAELVHIDFGVAFDQGKLLKTPEIVPFRLTRDIVDGMGVTGVEGVFRRCCEETMRVLRKNKEMLLTVLEVFVHDPLYRWALSAEKLDKLRPDESLSDLPKEVKRSEFRAQENSNAQRAIFSIKQKLQGTEFERMLSIEGQIKTLINEARDPNNLHQMFVGWTAWI